MVSRILSMLRLRNQRRHKRFNVDLPFIIIKSDAYPQGVRYQAADWSLGGFKLEQCGEKVKEGDILQGDIQFLSGPRGSFIANVAHIHSEGTFGARFLEIIPAEFLFPVKE